MAAETGRSVVDTKLYKGMQDVLVQNSQLLSGADLLQVLGKDDKEVAKGMERVEKLQDQCDLAGKGRGAKKKKREERISVNAETEFLMWGGDTATALSLMSCS